MRPEPVSYLRDDAGKLRVGDAASSWRRPQPAGRELRTLLTDEDFQACGLLVQTKFDLRHLLDTRFDPAPGEREGERWLVRDAVNDYNGVTWADGHDWLPAVERRLSELRAIAAEEALSFDETSAAAALGFLRRLTSVRRPGAFLVGGNARLVWDTAAGEQVGLQFRGADKVQFVILQTDGGELGSLMGVRSADAVLRMLVAPDIAPLLAR